MATFYTNLYKLPPNAQPGSERVYEGPSGPMAEGTKFGIFAQFDNVVAPGNFGANAGDVLRICKVPQGAKLIRLTAVPSGDLDGSNTFTFNLGWTSVANAFAAASTGLQGATAFNLAADAIITAANSADGDDLILTRVAGALTAAGSVRFLAEFLQLGR